MQRMRNQQQYDTFKINYEMNETRLTDSQRKRAATREKYGFGLWPFN